MTSYAFFKQMVINLCIYNDSFAWINRNSYSGGIIEIVPIIATSYTLRTPAEMPDRIYIDFTLKNGTHKILPEEQVIHFLYDFGENEYFGDNNRPLIQVSSFNSDVWNNLVVWTKDNITIKGFLKTDSILNEKDMEQAKKDFSDLLKDNSSAYMTLDGKFDYIPVNDKSSPMDVSYIDKVNSFALDYFHMNENILNGTATTEQMESFHKTTLVPIFTMMEQELMTKLFSKKEILGFQHRIKFTCNSFEHMTPSEKTASYTLLTNQGVITQNELRAGYGFNRVEGMDIYMYSKNFAEAGKTDETSSNEKPKDEDKEVNNKDEEEGNSKENQV